MSKRDRLPGGHLCSMLLIAQRNSWNAATTHNALDSLSGVQRPCQSEVIHCFFFHSNLFLLVFLSVFPTLWHRWQKWKRYWLNLYPGSRNGVARIELTEAVSERSPVMVRRQPDRKVVRLADCISVVKLPPNAEAHPGGNMAAFCILTDEKKLVFAVEKEGCGEWVNKICENAFQKGISNAPRQVPHMEENQIYASREEVFEFRVTVQQSEASARCGLWGEFWLQPSEDSLVLKDIDSRQVIMGWPYKLLRRYGRDKVMLSIEAGRRCSSGPGTFNFETVQGDEILRHMELAIQQQKNGSTFGGSCSPHSPGSPLSRRPYSATLLDTQMNTSSDSSTYCDCVQSTTTSAPRSTIVGFSNATYSNSAVPIGSAEASGECLYAQPIMRSQELSHLRREYEEPVYSEPHDVMQPSLIPQTSFCAHPTNKVKLPITIETHHHGSQPEPVYSE
ncbi:hypothetical protein P4O66_013883, partial [Electrophorus voltai]